MVDYAALCANLGSGNTALPYPSFRTMAKNARAGQGVGIESVLALFHRDLMTGSRHCRFGTAMGIEFLSLTEPRRYQPLRGHVAKCCPNRSKGVRSHQGGD